MRLRTSLYLLFAVLLNLLTVQSALSAPTPVTGPHFADIIITTSETHMLLFGELRNTLTDEMLDGLHSGIPVNFSFFVELEKNVPNWPDKELTVIEFDHSLSYDTLKEIYSVETEESSKKIITTTSLAEATKLINEINGLKIVELNRLEPDQTYRLKVKANLYKKTLPMSLHNVIPFVSWWDLNTDWYTVEFTY